MLLDGNSPPSQRRLATNTSWSWRRPGLRRDEQVVKLAVLEMILDSRSSDPADATVDDHDLAMVDMPESTQIPATGPPPPRGPRGTRSWVARVTHTWIPACVSRS